MQSRIRLSHHVQLRIGVHDRVQFPLCDTTAGEVKGARRQAHVDDQGLDRIRDRPLPRTTCGPREVIHGAANIVAAAETVRREHLAEAQVAQSRCDTGQQRVRAPRTGDGAEHVRAVTVHVQPEIPVFVGNETGPADALAPVRDIHVPGVESGVEHGHRNAFAREP